MCVLLKTNFVRFCLFVHVHKKTFSEKKKTFNFIQHFFRKKKKTFNFFSNMFCTSNPLYYCHCKLTFFLLTKKKLKFEIYNPLYVQLLILQVQRLEMKPLQQHKTIYRVFCSLNKISLHYTYFTLFVQ